MTETELLDYMARARRLAYRYAAHYHPVVTRNDMEGAVMLGLWQAAQRWHGVGSFWGYALARMRGALIDEVRFHGKNSKGSARAFVEYDSQLDDRALHEDAPFDPCDLAQVETSIDDFLQGRPERDQYVMREKLKGTTGRRIAEHLGIHETYVTLLWNRNFEMIEKKMEKQCDFLDC